MFKNLKWTLTKTYNIVILKKKPKHSAKNIIKFRDVPDWIWVMFYRNG